MYTHLRQRDYYEDLYDRQTVENGRSHQESFQQVYDEFFEKFPDEDPKRYGTILHMNIMYMALVGTHLLDRYDKRDATIQDWIDRDEAKDQQIANARLSSEPKCQHCGMTGLRIIDKSLMHRGEKYNIDDPEDVLIMLRCPHCDKNTAVWEDGSDWEHRHVRCPKCQTIMQEKNTRRAKIITTIYTCPDCGHTYKDKFDFTKKEKKEDKPDPDFKKDLEYYCLRDEKVRKELRDARYRFEEMARLGKEMNERRDNKHIYDAVKEMKKPKIAELSTLLSPVLEKAGFIEFSLDKPEIGKDVIIGFNCLDGKIERSDYESEKELKKTVEKSLIDTNWRLMSDGIQYRLGYLSGRLKAYEGEDNLKKLVERSLPKKKGLK